MIGLLSRAKLLLGTDAYALLGYWGGLYGFRDSIGLL